MCKDMVTAFQRFFFSFLVLSNIESSFFLMIAKRDLRGFILLAVDKSSLFK